jgi:glycosyltransferase involved in cell wall biosynthesis
MQTTLASFRAPSPQLPLGIVLRAPIWDANGYADEARNFAKALASSERDVAIEDLHWSDRVVELRSKDQQTLKRLQRAQQPRYAAAITSCIPTIAPPRKPTSLNILRTTFETDRIPNYWMPYLSAYDEVWVMSEFNRRSFIRSWFPPEKLRVVHGCVDTDIFRPDGPRLALPDTLANRFVFLSIFDWHLRKGWDVLLKAYCAEFEPNDHVGLLLKITRNHGHSWEQVFEQANAVLSECQQSLKDRPDIVLWDETLSAMDSAYYRDPRVGEPRFHG